jgi:hypothetical protein
MVEPQTALYNVETSDSKQEIATDPSNSHVKPFYSYCMTSQLERASFLHLLIPGNRKDFLCVCCFTII